MPKRKAKRSVSPNPKKRIKKEDESTPKLSHEISDYEKNILENIRRNNELLTELNIFQVRNDLRLPKATKKKPVKPVKMKEKEDIHVPKRQSLRIRKLQPDGVTALPDLPAVTMVTHWQKKPRHKGPIPMSLVNDVEEEDAKTLLSTLDNFMSKSTKSTLQHHISSDCSSYKSLMDKMKIEDHHVRKVVPQRVFSIAFHGMDTKTILFVGDKRGHLGLWDIDSKEEDNVFIYEPHISPITSILVEPHDNNKLFTCSYDGSIRCADFRKTAFDEVCSLDDDTCFTYMAFGTTSSKTIIASTDEGQVYIVDARTNNRSNPCYGIQEKAIKCLDVHPKNQNMFVTSTNKGTIALWDVRKLKGPKSCLNTICHSRSVSSVFFSPTTGEQLLATSMDNTVSVHDIDENAKATTCAMYRHDNYTGRWLSTFHARWDPKTSNCFAVGSMKYPRQVDIFSSAYKAGPLTHLQHDNFTTITSRIAFHPTKNVVAGANSSGKVFLWTV